MPAPILTTLRGQDTARETLERALERQRVHHAYLFEGPAGVGKELAAMGLAQALLCERRAPGERRACGECSACTRVVIREGEKRPVHPDLVFLGLGLYSAQEIDARTDEKQGISLKQVKALVLARAAFAPHEGKARVFVIRAAEELNVEAANALLKTLEEPNDRTHFVLLSSAPDAILSTIRSRTQRVRFGALTNAIVVDLLTKSGTKPEDATAIARLARGSMTEARALADPEAKAARDAFVDRALASLGSRGIGALLEVAEAAKKDKGELPVHLAALAQRLAEESVRAALDNGPAVPPANRFRLALAALRQLDGNASAQLTVESMLLRMRAE